MEKPQWGADGADGPLWNGESLEGMNCLLGERKSARGEKPRRRQGGPGRGKKKGADGSGVEPVADCGPLKRMILDSETGAVNKDRTPGTQKGSYKNSEKKNANVDTPIEIVQYIGHAHLANNNKN